MRLWCALALLSACVAPTQVREPVRAAPPCPQVSCPTCPACLPPVCPACPAEPAPAATEAPDWYCHDVAMRQGRLASSYCWVSEEICQSKRRWIERKWRRSSAGLCMSQPIAHCFQVTSALAMMRQTQCMRTRKDCEEARQEFLDDLPVTRSSACQEMRNVDAFDTLVNFPLATR